MAQDPSDPELTPAVDDPLRDHARFWLERTAVRIWRPYDLQHQYQRVAEIEQARPGFSAALRVLALEQLGATNPHRVWQAVGALAVVGEHSDIAALEPLAVGGTRLAKDARSAIFEISRRPAAT